MPRALSKRRIYEEGLAALSTIRPEQVVDPGSYFFHRAVAEHALALKKDATRSLTGLLEDVADAPDRYRLLGLLMLHDMESWREKDLGDIARKMDNIERRLELARGGPQTQKIQKEVDCPARRNHQAARKAFRFQRRWLPQWRRSVRRRFNPTSQCPTVASPTIAVQATSMPRGCRVWRSSGERCLPRNAPRPCKN